MRSMDEILNPPKPVPPPCVKCGATQSAALCGGCKTVRYCSVACQKADWPAHRKACAPKTPGHLLVNGAYLD